VSAAFARTYDLVGRVATDGGDEGGSVTFLEDSKFFFTQYHLGKVNIILHLVSFSFLFSQGWGYAIGCTLVPVLIDVQPANPD
jgi:hypothetical protein